MGAFVKQRRGGQIVATFAAYEADLIRSLTSQVVELLEDGQPTRTTASEDPLAALFDFAEPVREPEDPVLLRLLPNAYLDDEEAAAEFRRFTESTLRDAKVSSARSLLDSLQAAGLTDPVQDSNAVIDVQLDQPGALAWLKALNDIRLALATRLGIEEGEEAFWENLPEDDPRFVTYQLYGWLAYLQETLVASLG